MADAGPVFIHEYAARGWVDPADGLTHARCPVRPDMRVPGTRRVRLGHVASVVDYVGSCPPDGPRIPTLSLRAQSLRAAPPVREIRFVNRPLKDTGRFFVANVLAFADDAATPFAVSTLMAMNERLPLSAGILNDRPVLPATTPFEKLLPIEYVDDRTARLEANDRIVNQSFHRTILGSVQVVVAELVAERALAGRGRYVATDIDIRFLGRIGGGVLETRTEILSADASEASVQVQLGDAGASGPPAGFASVRLEAAAAGGTGDAAPD